MAPVTDPLRRHHKQCDHLFAAAEETAQKGQWADCNQQFVDFRREIEAHFSGEETVLFPAFEQASGMTGGPTQVMRMEHEQMRGLTKQMAQAVAERDSDAFCGAAETLLMLMQQHNMKEENILYPMCDQTLSASANDIGKRLQSMLTPA
jgi:hemerythrin-like domain-containing protein